MLLSGQFISKVAKAKRLLLPRELRSALGHVFYATRWYEKSIVFVPLDNWESFIEKTLGSDKSLRLAKRDSERFLLGGSFKLKQDKQGRIVMPTLLINHAKLGVDVVFVGLRNRIELWDKKEWDRRESHILTHAGSMLESISRDA